jgi:hypothetical protein
MKYNCSLLSHNFYDSLPALIEIGTRQLTSFIFITVQLYFSLYQIILVSLLISLQKNQIISSLFHY